MSKLQRKCFTGAFLAHGLLALVLIFGSAFLSSHEPPEAVPVVFSLHTTDALTATGDPTKTETPAPQHEDKVEPTPPPVAPPEKPADKKQVDKPIEHPKPPKREAVRPRHQVEEDEPTPDKTPDKSKPAVPLAHSQTGRYHEDTSKKNPSSTAKTGTSTPAHSKPTADLGHVVTRADDTAATEARAEAQRAEQARRLALAKAIGGAISAVTTQGPNPTEISLSGGGSEFANYNSVIVAIYKSKYEEESLKQGDFGSGDASLLFSVTVSRDGKVRRHEILAPSGNSTFDAVVRRVLRSVDFIAPFPTESKDSERTFKLQFNLNPNRPI